MLINIILPIITLIIGVVVTIIVGARYSMKPSLYYYQIEPGSIFSKNIKEITNLKILYNDNELHNDVILLKVLISNNGNTDIDKSMIMKPLCIEFKHPIELLNVTIEKNNDISMKVDGNKINFFWDLLKKKDYFILKIVLKICNNDNNILSDDLLNKYTYISSGITNLNKVKKYRYGNIFSNSLGLEDVFASGFQTLLIIPFCIFFIYFLNNSYIIKYKGSFFNSDPYIISPIDSDKLKLTSLDEYKKIIINIDEFNNTENINKIIISKEYLFNNIFSGIILLLIFYQIFSLISKIRKYFRIKQIRSYFLINR